jgi:IS1 family transposase
MANHLKPAKVSNVLSHMVEGSSVRSTERLTGVKRDTILRHLVKVGQGCARLMDREMRGLTCDQIQVDEIWSFVGKKQRWVDQDKDDAERVGDIWVFIALDAQTKLVPSFRVGKRTSDETRAFINDLSGRIQNRVQVSSDQLSYYAGAVAESFGSDADYGQIVKSFEAVPVGAGRYSPPKVTSVEKVSILGMPDEDEISTSYVERNNLNIRMGLRRFTRLTNAFSKKAENHEAAIALWLAWYNFGRIHKTLRVTPAMAAGVSSTVWDMPELIERALAA